ncbi:DUF3592 domain-containing protein [Streptomyces sp. NBS 14/10]|uniref:DUF3592 domain-containing protein n=1 Tax=Streptomyces sp. NBS 14/10 TaxID=1945643 RepID=UPI000B7DDD9B|nr:DUF3592 domain-containing protein [Streptomyces sp. NBS 14/10]KAK1177984.1 DUF3592 domain-containing protein [Streptomyces sp. NBS 14/10]
MWRDLLFMLIVGLVGGLLTGVCVRYCTIAWSLWRNGVHTIGVVVDNKRTGGDSGPKFHPVIAFHDQQGNQVVCQPFVSTDEKRPVGQKLPVLYLAHKPKIMYPQEGWHLIRALLSNWLLLVMGLVFLTGAVFMAPRPA